MDSGRSPVERVELLEVAVGGLGQRLSTTTTTITWALAERAEHQAVRGAGIERWPVTTRPTMPPSSAAAVSNPAARPRLPVGNSSARYTASAGKAMPPMTPPSSTDSHISGPPTANDTTTNAVDTGRAMAIRRRRPRRVGERARRGSGRAPAGVAVTSVNSAIVVAAKPRTSLR